MQFVCLGFFDESAWNSFSQDEQLALMQKCMAYDEELSRGKHFAGGYALQPPNEAVTVRIRNGQVGTTDGPFIETKEYLGGILILEARDLNHAIQLISMHPGVRMGGFEIRPMNEEITARAKVLSQQ